jgi:integrase
VPTVLREQLAEAHVRHALGLTTALQPDRQSADSTRSSGDDQAAGAPRAGLPDNIGCHTFRATGITAYLRAGGTIERAAQIANRESTRTTQLYNRTSDEIPLDEIERIVI